MNIGKHLKELRVQFELTQEAVAKLLGISGTAYSRYEKNERPISVKSLIILADHYDVTLDELCGRTR